MLDSILAAVFSGCVNYFFDLLIGQIKPKRKAKKKPKRKAKKTKDDDMQSE